MKQIKNLVYTLLLSVFCATMFTACTEEEGVVDAKDLVLSKEEVVFLAEPGESQSVTFTANADWMATSEQGWILIDTPVGKKGESTVTVNVKPNSEKVARQGNVVIKEPSTGKMTSFKVKQEAQGVNFVVSKEVGELLIDNENKVISERISIAANFKYDIQIKGVDWVTYSIDENSKDIIFYADNEKATEEPKDIAVEFVPVDEENVETQSWTLKWKGFTPSIEFYKDEACTQLIGEEGVILEESMNGFQAAIYVKSNVVWSLPSKEEIMNTILSSVDNRSPEGTELLRVFSTTSTLFAVFNKEKLSNVDQSVDLNFDYGSNVSTVRIIKEATSDFVEIDVEDFNIIKDNNPNGDYLLPMFDAMTGEGKVLSLDFSIRTFYNQDELTPVFMEFNNSFQICNRIITLEGLSCVTKSSDQSSNIYEYTYTLSVPERNESEDTDRYFMLFIVPNYNPDTFLTDYFLNINTPYMQGYMFKEEFNTSIGNVKFGQYAYEKEYTFTSQHISKDTPVLYKYNSSKNSLKIEFETDYMGFEYYCFDENIDISEDKKYIDGYLKSDWVSMSELDPGKSITFEIGENEGEKREVVLYLGVSLGEGKPVQYFGAFKIEQEAGTPKTK